MRTFVFLSIVAIALASHEKCGKNSHFEQCGTACPLTCENLNNPPKFCILSCGIGCHCDEGYVKTSDERCVLPEECPNFADAPEPNCVDEPKPGMCLAYIPSWYYDPKDQQCKKFIYGGCQGNGNRYPSKEACLENCGVHNARSKDVCDMPAETGLCEAYFPRYYFDRSSGTCQKFVYGGCGGNENNFRTLEECQKSCARAAPSACMEEKKIGNCKALFIRYYYNKETGKCEEFAYGGCNGNSNNFLSKEDCEDVCNR